MSAPFLTTKVANMRIAVEVAWGADLTDLTAASWTWSDITDDVLLEGKGGSGGGSGKGGGNAKGGSISITLGRPDFSAETQTAEMTCQLDNRDGTYSEGGMSPHWPYVRRNTPVRVRVSNNGGTDWYTRFQGAANGFTPQWDAETGRWATVELSASGPLRRLNQGTLPAKSVYSTEIPRSTSWPSMFMYWPCENGDGVRKNPTLVPASGHPALVLDTNYRPKVANNPSNAAFPMSGPLQSHFKMYTGQGFVGGEQIPTYTDTGILQVRHMFAIPGAIPTLTTTKTDTAGDTVRIEFPGAQWEPLFTIRTTNSTVPSWSLQINDLGSVRIVGSDDSIIREGVGVAWDLNGEARFCAVTFSNSGSSLNVVMRTKDFATGANKSFTWNFSSSNIGILTGIDVIGPDCSPEGTGTDNVLVAHVSVHNSNHQINTADVTNLILGLRGETVLARLARLCANHNIPLTILDSAVAENASITDTMGPQFYDTLTALLRECETTGQGVLYDGLNAGLTYVTKRRRETNANSAPSLTIDASAAQLMEPFAPVDDDQVTINHCDVSVRNGAVVSYIDATGPVGGEAIGDYATSYTVNSDSDVDLIHYAQWTVGVGTQQGYRYPSVSFALETNPSLIAGWLACTPQARIDVTNVATIRRQHPDETIKLLLEGWHEELDAFTWRVTANTSSAVPWNIVVLAAATGSTGDGICHMDTDDSQLNASVSAGATSIDVRTNSGPLWVTTSGDADSFPFDIDIGGIKATVTAISAATSPQTFTLSTGLPRAFTGSTTPGAGAPIKVWRPPVLGL